MTIQKTLDQDTLTIAVAGRLDTTTTPQLEAELAGALAGIEELNFDFAALDYISSSGLRVLLSAYKNMSKQGGSMAILNANEVVSEIFEVTGFSDFLDIR